MTNSSSFELRSSLTKRLPEIICAVSLLVMIVNLTSVAAKKSITNDEVVHIPAGYHYWVGGDFRQNPEHPPLIKMWAALPLLVLRPQPASFERPQGEDFGSFTLNSANEFWKANADQFRTIIFLARLPMILLAVVLGLLVFHVARKLFNAWAGAIAVAIFTLEPTVLAHAMIVHTDVAAAFAYLLFFYTLYRFVQSTTMKSALAFGLATGLALLIKFSLIILVPIFFATLVFVLWRAVAPRRKALLQVGAAVLCCLLLVNAFYYFRHRSLPASESNWISANFPHAQQNLRSAIPVLTLALPTYYIFGFLVVFDHNKEGHESSLLGSYRREGWWYYFPITFSLKTTVPFLLLSVVSLLWAVWMLSRRDWTLLLLLVPILLYVGFAMSSKINIGIRHLLPVFPFLCIVAAAFIDWTLRRSRVALLIVVLLGCWMVIDAVRIYPNYLTFISPLAGEKPGWQLLSDSNVEWGQDVGEMCRYLRAKGETEIQGALSGGWVSVELNGVRVIDFPPRNPEKSLTRYVAVGASHLNGATNPLDLHDENGNKASGTERFNYLEEYRSLQPEKVFGRSIYLYRIR